MNNQFNNPELYESCLTCCRLCGSKKINIKYIIKQYNPPFRVDICGECGFIFMNPRFKQKIISNLYSENYYKGNAEYSYYDERDAEEYALYVWEKRLKKILKYSGGGNFLDVGCAFGGFLKAAFGNFVPYGIEFSEYSGKAAKEIFGNNIHIGTLDDHHFKKSFFSVITMIELIEHLKDPVSAVSQCYELLNDGGLLVIQTANMNAVQARMFRERYAYFMPGHLSYFTKENLCNMLKNAGFRKIKVYQPVEFGLLPKLLKSRYNFNSFFDYYRWIKIAFYHYISKIRLNNFAVTSSMVVYAVK